MSLSFSIACSLFCGEVMHLSIDAQKEKGTVSVRFK
jgi:hypothetical protein